MNDEFVEFTEHRSGHRAFSFSLPCVSFKREKRESFDEFVYWITQLTVQNARVRQPRFAFPEIPSEQSQFLSFLFFPLAPFLRVYYIRIMTLLGNALALGITRKIAFMINFRSRCAQQKLRSSVTTRIEISDNSSFSSFVLLFSPLICIDIGRIFKFTTNVHHVRNKINEKP